MAAKNDGRAGVTRDANPEPQAGGQTSTAKTPKPSNTKSPTRNNGAQKNAKPGRSDPRRRATEIKDKITNKKAKMKDKTRPPGGFDTTPLPEVPPGYTVKFTFHKASNLPPADFYDASADPYIKATLTTATPRRHKEDPPLVFRTRTIQKSTSPEWEEDWIVANIPASGFRLKCRIYDEDYPEHDDRLGNVTVTESRVDEKWRGLDHKVFDVKKRVGSKKAYLFKAATTAITRNASMTPRLELSIRVLGRSDPPGAQIYTVGPTTWVRHFSPMIGRLTGVKVNKDERRDETSSSHPEEKQAMRYDFQANEIQLQGPVPAQLYHRYVEFRPLIGRMFTSRGIRGRLLNKALHKQHNRVYNFGKSTQHGSFEPCSEEATLELLKMVHFDEGGRIFTYVLTLDGILRFTETGKEFGIDMLSKHTMHSDVATYVACSGEFFIRRLRKPTAEGDQEPSQPTHPKDPVPGGPPDEAPPQNPSYYQLVIDNDSGTYRPDKSILPLLKSFLERNFPGLGIVAMHWTDKELERLKENQAAIKKKEGRTAHELARGSPVASSLSSDDERHLGKLDLSGEGMVEKTRKERAWDVLEDPSRIKREIKDNIGPGRNQRGGSPTQARSAPKSQTAPPGSSSRSRTAPRTPSTH